MERVLIIAAHPDDEVLGVGGTAIRHAKAGDQVRALIVAEGATSRQKKRPVKNARGEVEALRAAAKAAARVMGCLPPLFAGLPDNRLDSIDLLDVVKEVEKIIAQVKPTIIYTHHCGDLNIDHGIVARAVHTAARPLPGSEVQAIYAFETVSSTEWHARGDAVFDPNHFVDISPFLAQKLAALKCYKTEMRDFPHPRSLDAVEALAQWRGATVGMRAAEAFDIVRQISRI
jgi:LmbE family N-acetylglucosaminyl deacetylase